MPASPGRNVFEVPFTHTVHRIARASMLCVLLGATALIARAEAPCEPPSDGAGWRLDDPRAPAPRSMALSCRDGRLDALSFRVRPGEDLRLALRAPSGAGAVALVDALTLPQGPVFALRPGREPGRYTLTVRAPEGAAAGARFSAGLETADGDRLGLSLEVIEQAPLFRDDFGVDPVIGQFSMVHDD
jgi:hypothetical protein